MPTEIPTSWLQARLPEVSVSALVAHEIEQIAPHFDIPKEKIAALVEKRPKERWSKFLEGAESGDELWSFSSPQASWQNLCGAAGYAIVRSGTIVASVVTLRN